MAPREYVPYGEGIELTLDVLERSPVATLVLTPDHGIRYVNAELERLFGYARTELVGRPYEELFPHRLRSTLRLRLETFFASPRHDPIAFRPDFTAMRRDGEEFPMQYVAMPVENRHGLWVVVNIFDRTAERRAAERIETLNRAYLTLARMNQAVGRAGSVSELFDQTCRVAVEEGGFLGAWLGELDAAGVVEPVAVCGVVGDYVSSLRISTDPEDPSSAGPTGMALRGGCVVHVDDFGADSRTAPWRSAAAPYGIASSISLPLRRGGRPAAVLNLYAERPHGFDEETRTLLEGLAYNVSFALDGFDRAHRLEELSWQRRRLLQRLVRAEESERHRIAADLHDESVQALAAAELRLSTIESAAQARAPELAPRVAAVRQLLGSTMRSLRELMFDLEPPEADAGLGEALREAAAQVFVDSRLRWDVRVEERPMERVQRTQALRIAKEALINVRKHADATRVAVEALRAGAGVLFQVCDNGRGFAEPEITRPGHRGLQTMRERAELAGGWFRHEPAPGGGTQVEWWLPVDDAADDDHRPALPGPPW